MNGISRNLFGLAVAIGVVASYLVPDAPAFQRPELARIFFWHFPCPMLASILLMLGAYQSVRCLLSTGRARLEWDLRARTSLEIGYMFCLLTMATGIVFSLAQWNAWWQWDPRQTSFLYVLLLYAAYFGLRGAYSDPERRSAIASAYAAFSILPALFLIFVYPRLPQISEKSFHPTDSIMGGNIKGWYAVVIVYVLTLVCILTVWLYRLAIRAGKLELSIDERYGQLETVGGGAPAARVAQRLPLPEEGGKQGPGR